MNAVALYATNPSSPFAADTDGNGEVDEADWDTYVEASINNEYPQPAPSFTARPRWGRPFS